MHLRRACHVAQGKIDIIGERTAHADRQALLDHDDVARANQLFAQRRGREWAERHQRDEADSQTVGAHLVDGVFDGAVHRSHGDDDQFSILGTIRTQQPATVAQNLSLNSAANSEISRSAKVCW